VIATLSAAPAVSADAAWSPATRLGPMAADVDVAVDASGDAVAVWSTSRHVLSAYRPAGKGWRPAEQVDRGGSTGWARSVVIAPSGKATTVWYDDHGAVHVSDRTRGGRWTDHRAPKVLRNPAGECTDGGSYLTGMAAGPSGDVVFTWSGSACEGYDYWNSFVWRYPDGTWGPVRDGGGGAVAFTGRRVATFFGSGQTLSAERSVAGGPLRDRTTLATVKGGGFFQDPDVAVNPRGDIALAALQLLPPYDDAARVVTVTRPAGGHWLPANEWTASSARVPRVAVGARGATAVAYLVHTSRGERVAARRSTVARPSWGPPTTLSGPMPNVSAPEVAVGAHGAAAVVWTAFKNSRPYFTRAAYRATGSWTSPTALAGANRSSSRNPGMPWPQVEAGPRRFTAVFVANATLFSDHP
jgi:hypothetical protein